MKTTPQVLTPMLWLRNRFAEFVKNLFGFQIWNKKFFSSSSPFVFFLYLRAARVIFQEISSRQRTPTLTLENWRTHFSRAFSLLSRSLSYLLLSFRSRKFVTPLIGNLRSFGVFSLAKCCGSFNRFKIYFLRSFGL